MTTEIVPTEGHRHELAQVNEFAPLKALDVYAGGVNEQAPRVDALATISLGYMGKDGNPRPTRREDERWIHLHDDMGRAPELKAALERGHWRGLTIAFPFSNPNSFVQSYFAEYSKSALRIYGDEHALTVIRPPDAKKGIEGGHAKYPAGTPEYATLLKRCKVQISIYFVSARWINEQAQVVMPDGLSFYRLRSTSRHTLDNLRSAIDSTARFTRGQIAGIPFDLGVSFPQVADPTGAKRTIPTFTFTMRPPVELTSNTFQVIVGSGLDAGRRLQLPPPPSPESLETAMLEGPTGDSAGGPVEVIQPSPAAVDVIAEGGYCNRRHYRNVWFATVRGTSLGSDEARAEWLAEYTSGQTRSLADFLAGASTEQADELIDAMLETLAERGEIEVAAEDERPADIYDRLYGSDDDDEAYASMSDDQDTDGGPQTELQSGQTTFMGDGPAAGDEQPVLPPDYDTAYQVWESAVQEPSLKKFAPPPQGAKAGVYRAYIDQLVTELKRLQRAAEGPEQ